MTNEKALEIANDFLKYMNPDLWNGEGEMPDNLDTRIWEEKDLHPDLYLDISMENNGIEGWYTYVELVDKATDCMIECSSCYGIDSPQNIADAIMNLCELHGII